MPKFEYKHLSHHFKFTSQQSKMNATPASVERVQKYVFNFEIYRFVKKSGQFTPSSPTYPQFINISINNFFSFRIATSVSVPVRGAQPAGVGSVAAVDGTRIAGGGRSLAWVLAVVGG